MCIIVDVHRSSTHATSVDSLPSLHVYKVSENILKIKMHMPVTFSFFLFTSRLLSAHSFLTSLWKLFTHFKAALHRFSVSSVVTLTVHGVNSTFYP